MFYRLFITFLVLFRLAWLFLRYIVWEYHIVLWCIAFRIFFIHRMNPDAFIGVYTFDITHSHL